MAAVKSPDIAAEQAFYCQQVAPVFLDYEEKRYPEENTG